MAKVDSIGSAGQMGPERRGPWLEQKRGRKHLIKLIRVAIVERPGNCQVNAHRTIMHLPKMSESTRESKAPPPAKEAGTSGKIYDDGGKWL